MEYWTILEGKVPLFMIRMYCRVSSNMYIHYQFLLESPPVDGIKSVKH